MPKPTFYIIDGHAHIFRAFYAPFRDLTSSTGEPTKATFVFTQMLINIVEQKRPDYLLMVIDSGDEDVFRSVVYPEYKQNRSSPPAEFKPQEQRILQIVRDSGVPVLGKNGFEADDIIATLVKELHEEFDLFLVSKDKDLRQLLREGVVMYDPPTDVVFDEAALIAKCGYTAKMAVDIQTLMGDAIDNVPGIPGVGEKTAAELLNRFGSVEGIYENLEQLKSKKKLVENLTLHRHILPVTRQLVTLRDDVPLEEFSKERCKFDGFNVHAITPTLDELGMRSLSARLIGAAASPPPPKATPAKVKPQYQPFGDSLFGEIPGTQGDSETGPVNQFATSVEADYELIDTDAAFDVFLRKLQQQKRIAFDVETTSLRPLEAKLAGLSVSWDSNRGHYIAVRAPAGKPVCDEARVLAALKPILEDVAVAKVGHNIKYDALVMRNHGILLAGVVADTMVEAFVIDSSRLTYGIDRLAQDLLTFQKIATADLLGSGKNMIRMDEVDPTRVARYASEDVDITWRLDTLLDPKLNEFPALRKLFDEVELPLIDVLVEMEFNGVAVDPVVLKEQSVVLGGRIEILKAQILEAAGTEFNPDSPKQLADVLFNKLKLRIIKKTKTGPSTDVEVLERLASEHAVPKLILEYRSLVKLKNTYLDNLTEHVNPQTGRIHTSFNQTGAATGRLSSSDPNLQNIPIRTDEGRAIRLAFVPGDQANNVLLSADYSQIELRVLAHFTHEPALMKAFENDEDIHRAVASEVFGVELDKVSKEHRNQAKTINFGIVYGVTAGGLARRIDGLSFQGAAELIERYNARFPGIKTFLDLCVEKARTHGFVETILGRRRPIINIHSPVLTQRNAAERVAINSVVQGSAADLIKVAMVNLHRRLARENVPAKLLLQVHDELVLEVPRTEADRIAKIVKEEMEGAMKLDVPVKVETGWGPNWQETK